MTRDEVDQAIHELMKYEDWDSNAYFIMQLYRKDKKQLLVALSAHKIKIGKGETIKSKKQIIIFRQETELVHIAK